MKTPTLLIAFALLLSGFASAKDDVITLDRCPVPVQKVIQQYASQNKIEEIGFDKKTKSGGPPVYEVKFTGQDGKRFEVHISPEGKVLEIEPKKPKL
jgi:hypothetical protein